MIGFIVLCFVLTFVLRIVAVGGVTIVCWLYEKIGGVGTLLLLLFIIPHVLLIIMAIQDANHHREAKPIAIGVPV